MFLGNALISEKAKKKDVISKSSIETEYHDMSIAGVEIVWLHGLLDELGFAQLTPTPLHANKTSGIHIAADAV